MILKELKIHTNLADPTNCYIVFDEESKETMVIDPAGEIDKIIEMIEMLGNGRNDRNPRNTRNSKNIGKMEDNRTADKEE